MMWRTLAEHELTFARFSARAMMDLDGFGEPMSGFYCYANCNSPSTSTYMHESEILAHNFDQFAAHLTNPHSPSSITANTIHEQQTSCFATCSTTTACDTTTTSSASTATAACDANNNANYTANGELAANSCSASQLAANCCKLSMTPANCAEHPPSTSGLPSASATPTQQVWSVAMQCISIWLWNWLMQKNTLKKYAKQAIMSCVCICELLLLTFICFCYKSIGCMICIWRTGEPQMEIPQQALFELYYFIFMYHVFNLNNVMFQETLIVWSEDDTCDLALSFQEKPGCDDIWQKICKVQVSCWQARNTKTKIESVTKT